MPLLTEADREFFEENGYVVVEGAVPGRASRHSRECHGPLVAAVD